MESTPRRGQGDDDVTEPLPAVPQGSEFQRMWRSLTFADRLRIRFVVAYGQAVRDPSLASPAAGLARKWLDHPLVRFPMLSAVLTLATCGLMAVVFLLLDHDESLGFVPIAALFGLSAVLSAPSMYKRAENGNRTLAARARPR